MKRSGLTVFAIFMLVAAGLCANNQAAEQQHLDQACEAARESKLAPLRQQHIEECVQQQKKDRAYCERFYSDYGARSGRRAPLFYDLPECVKAFEQRRKQR
ncbi:MAG: hypothetical protein KZQ58_06550 [gamma proteobacterium symbiont of Bathyaustriella thionipta]|nr:hypothetical protein [gamma proteobacterium symbiont of Bathyaustriella thionipta]